MAAVTPEDVLAIRWKQYVDTCFPLGVHPVQHSEMQKAFYAGCQVVYSILQELPEDEDVAMVMIEGLQKSIDAFITQLNEKPVILIADSKGTIQ